MGCEGRGNGNSVISFWPHVDLVQELREVLVGIEKTEGYFFHSSVRGLFVLCVFGTEPETCKGSSYPQHALLSSGGSLYSCTNWWGWPVDLGS